METIDDVHSHKLKRKRDDEQKNFYFPFNESKVVLMPANKIWILRSCEVK